MTDHKTVTITKTVPVNNRETLDAYLNDQLKEWIGDGKKDAGTRNATAGSKAIRLIEEAGFKLQPPATTR